MSLRMNKFMSHENIKYLFTSCIKHDDNTTHRNDKRLIHCHMCILYIDEMSTIQSQQFKIIS